MKTITYERKKMERVGYLLGLLKVCGVRQARILSEIGDIIDSGMPGEISEKEDKNALHSKEVCQN